MTHMNIPVGVSDFEQTFWKNTGNEHAGIYYH